MEGICKADIGSKKREIYVVRDRILLAGMRQSLSDLLTEEAYAQPTVVGFLMICELYAQGGGYWVTVQSFN